jgi:hypothetical protein
LNIYKEYLETYIRKEQAIIDTKHKFIAIHLLVVVAYRLPKSGGKAAEWVMKHCVKKLIK